MAWKKIDLPSVLRNPDTTAEVSDRQSIRRRLPDSVYTGNLPTLECAKERTAERKENGEGHEHDHAVDESDVGKIRRAVVTAAATSAG